MKKVNTVLFVCTILLVISQSQPAPLAGVNIPNNNFVVCTNTAVLGVSAFIKNRFCLFDGTSLSEQTNSAVCTGTNQVRVSTANRHIPFTCCAPQVIDPTTKTTCRNCTSDV